MLIFSIMQYLSMIYYLVKELMTLIIQSLKIIIILINDTNIIITLYITIIIITQYDIIYMHTNSVL